MAAVAAAGIGAAASLLSGRKQRKAARREARLAREERARQQAILEKQKQEYRDIEFTNPYEGMQNQYAENVYEDLTVNQQQAQFQTQQGQQQRANIMAGLAQAMANQGQIQAQQISGSIGMQEARNQQLRAMGDQQRQRGAAAVDLSIRGGDAMVQQAESGRQATLLGVAQGGAAGANAAYQQQMLNQAQANASANQMNMNAFSSLAGADWSSFGSGGGGAPSGTYQSGGQSHMPDPNWKSYYPNP
jgi:hypothetical protein